MLTIVLFICLYFCPDVSGNSSHSSGTSLMDLLNNGDNFNCYSVRILSIFFESGSFMFFIPLNRDKFPSEGQVFSSTSFCVSNHLFNFICLSAKGELFIFIPTCWKTHIIIIFFAKGIPSEEC